jgi:hypothetical protein
MVDYEHIPSFSGKVYVETTMINSKVYNYSRGINWRKHYRNPAYMLLI